MLQNGTLVDAAPFFIMPGFGPVDAAALGDVFLVAGHQCGLNCETVTTFAARVRGTDGVVLGFPATDYWRQLNSSARDRVLWRTLAHGLPEQRHP